MSDDDKDWFRPSAMSSIEQEMLYQMKAHEMVRQYYLQFKRQFEQRKIIEYKSISSWNCIDDDINSSITEGWQPLGGMCIAWDDSERETLYAQAMVKYED